jgi:hypothetical protein
MDAAKKFVIQIDNLKAFQQKGFGDFG